MIRLRALRCLLLHRIIEHRLGWRCLDCAPIHPRKRPEAIPDARQMDLESGQ